MLQFQHVATPITNTRNERDLALEDFAAELTVAAYPLVLRQRPTGSWLDLELELWKVLRQTVRSWKRNSPGESRVF
jgi:hypothetical protein